MAFNRNNTNANAQQQGNDDSWKADGFINIYLPGADGKDRKIDAIPLKASKAVQKQLLEWLEKDPANIEKLASKLVLTYQSAKASDSALLALD